MNFSRYSIKNLNLSSFLYCRMFVARQWLENNHNVHQFHHPVAVHLKIMLQLFHRLQVIRVVHQSAVLHLQFQSGQLQGPVQLAAMVAWAVFHLIYQSNQLNVHQLWQVLVDAIHQVRDTNVVFVSVKLQFKLYLSQQHLKHQSERRQHHVHHHKVKHRWWKTLKIQWKICAKHSQVSSVICRN